ncbi:hypothetical protein GE21DRAFT_1270640 [Neurospora crassa]|nr:hypothetical protein GE21DRAFT_1270640 [Neurospora crassa]
MKRTYNTRDSLVVTDPTTSLALTGLSMGERTGSRVFQWLRKIVSDDTPESFTTGNYDHDLCSQTLFLWLHDYQTGYQKWSDLESWNNLESEPEAWLNFQLPPLELLEDYDFEASYDTHVQALHQETIEPERPKPQLPTGTVGVPSSCTSPLLGESTYIKPQHLDLSYNGLNVAIFPWRTSHSSGSCSAFPPATAPCSQAGSGSNTSHAVLFVLHPLLRPIAHP